MGPCANDKFNRYLQAVYDEQAVEGSLAADNIGAAIMIREKAIELGLPLADEKWATISKSLGVVLRRYGLSRKERKTRSTARSCEATATTTKTVTGMAVEAAIPFSFRVPRVHR